MGNDFINSYHTYHLTIACPPGFPQDLISLIVEYAQQVHDVGDIVEVLDKTSKWCTARVLQVRNDEVLVHYDGWSDRWDEWVECGPRIVKHGTRTLKVKVTGGSVPNENHMTAIISMGFSQQEATLALVQIGNDFHRAVSRLMADRFERKTNLD
eukprot:TRINITY_DN6875_c0_g1_i1.p1 TRINITY_DN6875_c0_g1~~TRINITY_DN6875_c0_g1_i1.p1  ORF type:complete len:154 (+),score=31.82 TRINITY_DN6875_c0_g1_i1:676-1137(+)